MSDNILETNLEEQNIENRSEDQDLYSAESMKDALELLRNISHEDFRDMCAENEIDPQKVYTNDIFTADYQFTNPQNIFFVDGNITNIIIARNNSTFVNDDIGLARTYDLYADRTFGSIPYETLRAKFGFWIEENSSYKRLASLPAEQRMYPLSQFSPYTFRYRFYKAEGLFDVSMISETQVSPKAIIISELNDLNTVIVEDELMFSGAQDFIARSLFLSGIYDKDIPVSSENAQLVIDPFKDGPDLEGLAFKRNSKKQVFTGQLGPTELTILDYDYEDNLNSYSKELVAQFKDHKYLFIEYFANAFRKNPGKESSPYGYVRKVYVFGWRKENRGGKGSYKLDLTQLSVDRKTLDEALNTGVGVAKIAQAYSMQRPLEGGLPGSGKKS
jgi:hypothetical protein